MSLDDFERRVEEVISGAFPTLTPIARAIRSNGQTTMVVDLGKNRLLSGRFQPDTSDEDRLVRFLIAALHSRRWT